ncbi:MAG: N-acetylneuraminate synthase family protein [Thermoleophilaceae bacterium]|nr:N-acetylneuraminate synthase family protein [Thermoleophilaceae bacterium]
MVGKEPPVREMIVGGIRIDDESPCFVIAEIGHNHQGSVETAKKLFAAAKEAGADAVKLQKRDNRSLFTRDFYERPYDSENSFGETYGSHREALEMGAGEYRELQAYAAELGIGFFSTAFDRPSVDFLEEIDVPAYKVASGDIRNVPLLRHLAQTGKPIILSTGGALPADVARAYSIVSAGSDNVGILQCTAGYPAAWDELDLRVIQTYRKNFPKAVVGLSSHDNGIAMATAAHVLGARIVEKHFTLDRTMKGTDHSFSLEPAGLTKLVRDLSRLHVALGDGQKKVYESERAPVMKMSKKLVAARPLPADHVIGPDDIAIKSPGDGMCPSDFDRLIGARVLRRMEADTPFGLALVEAAEAHVGAMNGNVVGAGASSRNGASSAGVPRA